MTQDNTAKNSPVFQLKASLYTLTTLHLLEPNLDALTQQLSRLRQQAPKFFNSAPVIIDLQRLASPNESFDFAELRRVLTDQQLIIVGLRHAAEELREKAKQAGFAILPEAMTGKSSGAHSAELAKNKAAASEETKTESKKTNKTNADNAILEATPAALGSLLITKPVRSGQQIYAKQADLVIIAPVSEGAELIADGHIHVYGTLRGRALAGAQGNANARIFCQKFDAELLSIAGNYWLSDDLKRKKVHGPGQVFWHNESLQYEAL